MLLMRQSRRGQTAGLFLRPGAAHRGMGQKHFESKWIIEQYIHALGVAYTILRPAYFMNNQQLEPPGHLERVTLRDGSVP